MQCPDCPELLRDRMPPEWTPRQTCCLERGRAEREAQRREEVDLQARLTTQPSRQARRAMARAIRKGRYA